MAQKKERDLHHLHPFKIIFYVNPTKENEDQIIYHPPKQLIQKINAQLIIYYLNSRNSRLSIIISAYDRNWAKKYALSLVCGLLDNEVVRFRCYEYKY